MRKKVCAVVVTYNRADLLKENINALKDQDHECDLFVVNNHSDDGTEEFLKKEKIPHLLTSENLGGAGGFNLGIRKACELGYEYLWLMDDDCIPQKDALEKLMDADAELNGHYGFLASRVLWTDGSDHLMNKIDALKRKSDDLFLIDQATFVSLLIKRETVEKVGLPISDFFIWGDDIEYTRRIAVRNRVASYYVKNSIVIHKTKNNVGSKIAFDHIDNISRYRYAYRNEAFLYRQEGVRGRLYYFMKCVYNAFRILFLAKDNKIRRLDVLFSGIKEGLYFDPQTEDL